MISSFYLIHTPLHEDLFPIIKHRDDVVVFLDLGTRDTVSDRLGMQILERYAALQEKKDRSKLD